MLDALLQLCVQKHPDLAKDVHDEINRVLREKYPERGDVEYRWIGAYNITTAIAASEDGGLFSIRNIPRQLTLKSYDNRFMISTPHGQKEWTTRHLMAELFFPEIDLNEYHVIWKVPPSLSSCSKDNLIFVKKEDFWTFVANEIESAEEFNPNLLADRVVLQLSKFKGWFRKDLDKIPEEQAKIIERGLFGRRGASRKKASTSLAQSKLTPEELAEKERKRAEKIAHKAKMLSATE